MQGLPAQVGDSGPARLKPQAVHGSHRLLPKLKLKELAVKDGLQTAQGYLFGRPVPAKELRARIALDNKTIAPLKESAT